MELSVIVITRNEEARIRACLDACRRALERARGDGVLRTFELILVDSASTDRTLEFARPYPITIVRLRPEWPLSAAAGRFVGLRHAKGELILFVDGDYVLLEDWLPTAIRRVREDASVAAVCGRHLEEATGDSVLMQYAKALIELQVNEPEAVPIGLYRRRAVDAVGGIHPFLRGGEDRDLAHRLRAGGYRLVRVDQDMGIHRWSDSGPLDFVTYLRSVLAWSLGDGQALRARMRSAAYRAQAVRRYLNARHLRNHLLGLVLAILGLTHLAVLARTAPYALLLADAGLAGAIAAVRRRHRLTWRETAFRLHVVPYSLVRQIGFFVGLLRRPPDPQHYPYGESVVQEAPALDRTEAALAVTSR